ncbi:MAG TPA: hypothetical protein VNH38_01480 [Candidatus Dormibacteraeota bacterium]|nr:hypothetical protein [Candidatus Dormibacteraeota bacterium]
MSDRKQVLLRIDPKVHDALARWAADEFRSLNAQVEMVLRRALDEAGRMPRRASPLPKRGRPPAASKVSLEVGLK